MQRYPIPAKKIQSEIQVINSRFIATCGPVFSVEEAKQFVRAVKSEYADASHNVAAFIVGYGASVVTHSNDDGEPSGTAGRPALAVLTIFSVMWRWNDFLWPLIVLSRSELFTLQVGLNSFQGELNIQWHLILAMTVLTLLPITVVFAFLQKNITTGIATTGMK